jgi:hypothetical protein
MENPEVAAAVYWLGWLNLLKNVGAVLVVLGVAFELLGDWFSTPLSQKVDDARNAEIAALNNETARLSADAETARAQIANANARAAEAELRLVEFRRPRGVTPEQADSIVEKIKPFAGTKFDVGHSTEDREQWDFLWRLEPAISKAGWVHIDWEGGMAFKKNAWPGNHWYGIMAVINVSIELHPESREKLLPAAEALAAALNGIGITATAGEFNNSSTNADAIHVLIGPKR